MTEEGKLRYMVFVLTEEIKDFELALTDDDERARLRQLDEDVRAEMAA